MRGEKLSSGEPFSKVLLLLTVMPVDPNSTREVSVESPIVVLLDHVAGQSAAGVVQEDSAGIHHCRSSAAVKFVNTP